MNSNDLLTIILSISGIITLITLVTWLLRRYVAWSKTPYYALITTWLNWYLAISIVLLIPIDVSSSLHRACIDDLGNETNIYDECKEPWIHYSRSFLEVLWKSIYWTTYIMCWAIIPVMQSYVLTGHFHFYERLVSALKENILLYAAIGVVGGILGIWLLAKKSLGGVELMAIAMAAANAYGLFLVICLLGYGLTEIPRKLWRQAYRNGTLKYFQYKTFIYLESYEKSKTELENTLKLVKKWEEKIPRGDPFRIYLDIVLEKCPPEYKDIFYGEGNVEISYSKLVNLHKKLINAVHEYNLSKCLYEQLINKAFELEDILNNEKNPQKYIEWSFKPKRTGKFAKQINFLEWFWKIHIETKFYRTLSIIAFIMSICVVWSETFFGTVEKVNLSIFSLLITSSTNIPYIIQWLFIFIPISYIAFCAYWSLFSLRIFNYYRLVPHQQSDANSILFSAYYLARIISPMAYNFLLMIKLDESAFVKVMGTMNLAPLLGKEYNYYFPIILILLCAANIFNLYSKLIFSCMKTFSCCFGSMDRFNYDDDFTDSRIDKGKEILSKERELKASGRGLSIHIGLSFTKKKNNKNNKKKRNSFFNFFSKKKQNDNDNIELLEKEEI